VIGALQVLYICTAAALMVWELQGKIRGLVADQRRLVEAITRAAELGAFGPGEGP
jgi:hypothetical protein